MLNITMPELDLLALEKDVKKWYVDKRNIRRI